MPGFDRVERDTNKKTDLCDSKYQETTKKYILNSSKPIVIIGGRLQLYSTSKYFDNHEGGKDPEVLKNIKWRYKFVSKTQDSFKETIINEITELSKKVEKIILVYPIPEVGWNIPRKINNEVKFKNLISEKNILKNIISTSYPLYIERSKKSFEILLTILKGENIYRVYPHKLFCDTIEQNRCITHDLENIFYIDGSHPSENGSENK